MADPAPPDPADPARSDPARAAQVLTTLGSTIPFIQKLEAQDEGLISRLADVALFNQAKSGTVIFRQGDPGHFCFIVLSGEVEVFIWKSRESEGTMTPRLQNVASSFPSREEANAAAQEEQMIKNKSEGRSSVGESQVHIRFRTMEGYSTFSPYSCLGDCIAQLGPGCLFGELALMNNAPRAMSIRVTQDCELLSIQKEDYHKLHHDLLQVSETQVIDDFCGVLTERCGSVIKAWRTVLDPHAVGELLFSEFVEALTCLQWQGNTSALWGALVRRAHGNNRDVVVGLREIAPNNDWAVEQFKFWMEKEFDGAIEMFNLLTHSRPNASLKHAEFMAACQNYASEPNSSDHLKLIWEFLDPDDAGMISLKDVAFLEINGLKRKAAMEPSFVMALEVAKSSAQSLRKRARLQKRAMHIALTEFLRKLRAASGGSFIRGFRTVLDRNGNLCISKVEMLKGCRQVAFSGDVMALWKAMDQDGDGSVQLPELDVRMSLVLASFKKWCSEKHGGCVKAMQHLAAMTRRRTAKWSVDDFVAAVQLSSWQGVPGISLKQVAGMLHEAADLTGTRHMVAQDVAFLDGWEPTPWLCAEPDVQGKEQLIATLRARYVNLIVAWRRLFDRNNKNHVTFKDFQHACMYLQLKNAPGIWRALDHDHSGFISLKNIDHESAQVLLNFKEWAEDTFGSIQFAFRVLDTTHSKGVSLPVFKRVLSEFGFQGDARILFQSLKPDAGGRQCSRDARLRLEDMKHLSSWESQKEASFDEENFEVSLAGQFGEGEPVAAIQQESVVSPGGTTHSKKAEEPSISSPSITQYGKSRAYNSMSDFFIYCRVPKEHELFEEVRDMHQTKHRQGMFPAFCLDTVLQKDRSSGRDQFKLPPSPFAAPVVSTGFINTQIGRKRGGRQQMQSSVSLPTLSSSPHFKAGEKFKHGGFETISESQIARGTPVMPRVGSPALVRVSSPAIVDAQRGGAKLPTL